MMKQKSIWQQFSSLPPEAQRQAADFIAFLQTRYTPARSRPSKITRLSKEAFIGIWRNRKDMRNSTAWVRNLRAREWGQ
jgi:hypothetical protein